MTSPPRPVFTSVEAFLTSLTAADKRRIQRNVAGAMGLDVGDDDQAILGDPGPHASTQVAASALSTGVPSVSAGYPHGPAQVVARVVDSPRAARRARRQDRARRAQHTTSEVLP